jgi:hypothetical protein
MLQNWNAQKHDEMRRKFNKEYNQGKININPCDTRWWKIYIENPDRDDVVYTIGNIRDFAQWAFVYCYRENNITHLQGLIVFEYPHTGEWMALNINRYADYESTYDDSNMFRGIAINFEPVIDPDNWQILFDSGPYYGNLD